MDGIMIVYMQYIPVPGDDIVLHSENRRPVVVDPRNLHNNRQIKLFSNQSHTYPIHCSQFRHVHDENLAFIFFYTLHPVPQPGILPSYPGSINILIEAQAFCHLFQSLRVFKLVFKYFCQHFCTSFSEDQVFARGIFLVLRIPGQNLVTVTAKSQCC